MVRERNLKRLRTSLNRKGGTSGCLPEGGREGGREEGKKGGKVRGRERGRLEGGREEETDKLKV